MSENQNRANAHGNFVSDPTRRPFSVVSPPLNSGDSFQGNPHPSGFRGGFVAVAPITPQQARQAEERARQLAQFQADEAKKNAELARESLEKELENRRKNPRYSSNTMFEEGEIE